MDEWIDEWIDGWMDEWIDEWIDGWMDGWIDEWIDGWNIVLRRISDISTIQRLELLMILVNVFAKVYNTLFFDK